MISSRLVPVGFLVVVCALSMAMWGASARIAEPVQPNLSNSNEIGPTYKVDMAHSTLNFRLRQYGASWFYGRLVLPKGEYLLNDDGGFINVTVDIKNMDAGNRDRNRFLIGTDFFNEREYPTASFTSTSVKRIDSKTFEATGEFTMHGVTQDVSVQITDYTENATERFGYRSGFLATFTINRSEFGIDKFVKEGTLGDEVEIIAAIGGTRQDG